LDASVLIGSFILFSDFADGFIEIGLQVQGVKPRHFRSLEGEGVMFGHNYNI